MSQADHRADTIYVVRGTGWKDGKYHTDPDCRHLKQAKKVFEKSHEYAEHLERCEGCAGNPDQ